MADKRKRPLDAAEKERLEAALEALQSEVGDIGAGDAGDGAGDRPLTREDLTILQAVTEELASEVSSRWDPERLLRMVNRRAGRVDRLDESTRRRYEARLGADLSDVRVYSGEFAAEVAKAHQAEAVTVGATGMILMGGSPGRSMATAAGRALLAHELTHVAQAQEGMHRRASFAEATPLATEEHELEAQEMEAEELHGVSDTGQDEAARAEAEARVKDAVRRRVIELFSEDERLRRMRNGPEVWRP